MLRRRKKVLLLDSGKEWGGGTNSMLELLKRIDRKRFDVHCCFYHNYQKDNGHTIEDALAALDIPMCVIPQSPQPYWAKWTKELFRTLCFFSRPLRRTVTRYIDRFWRIAPNAKRIRALLAEGQYDMLYMNNQPASNLDGYYAAADLPVTAIQHCRIEPIMDAAIVNMVNRHVHRLICVSRGVQQKLISSGVDPKRCVIVFNGIDVNQPLPDGQALRSALGIDKHTFLFGSIGSLIQRKSHHHTVLALHQFQRTFPDADWKMVIVGAGPEHQALLRLTARHHLQDRVMFVGYQSNALEYLAAFDAFILASRSEGLPRVILEAMLLKTPLIASDVVGNAELVQQDKTGWSFSYGDIDCLSSKMVACHQNAPLRNRMAQSAYRQVKTHFTIERYVAGVESVLDETKVYKQTRSPFL